MGLVVRLAEKYVPHAQQRLSLQDLIQEGALGLVRAAEQFDASKEARFSTYATFWVRKFLLRAISEDSHVIRLPQYWYDLNARLRRSRRVLQQTLGRPATLEELAE